MTEPAAPSRLAPPHSSGAHRPGPSRRRLLHLALLAPVLAAPALLAPAAARAQATTLEGQVIDLKIQHAQRRLLETVSGANELTERAKGMLIIPGVTKAGLLVAGAYGEGALIVNGATVGYYAMASASLGLQAGAQTYDLALFFMTTAALERFRRSQGWELGADAEVVTPEDALAASLNTTTSRSPVLVIPFGQNGLMAGVSLAGAKYTRIVR